MYKKLRRLSIVLIPVLLIGLVIPPNMLYASSWNPGEVITGTYNYTSNENNNIQESDTFLYRNSFFMKSSFESSSGLEALSAQLAISSASKYGDNVDPYEVVTYNNGANVKDFLEKMGFEGVSTNKYYDLVQEEDSASVAVGHKDIYADGKHYTLLAIAPRSAGYKEEWVGNFNVGDGDIHKGFKAGRDEILRYIKQYIKEWNISGNLKVWITGHSRGSALANMLGGFFAGGGIDYFKDYSNVSITPEDVYCYTFATPTTVKDGVAKNTVLSVEGPRGGASYVNDTQTPAYTYVGGGTVNIKGEEYNGIRNIINPDDFITMLPPLVWNFEHYGRDMLITHDGVTEADMLEYFADISAYAANKYNKSGNFENFELKKLDLTKFDLETFGAVTDEDRAAMTLGEFMTTRIDGLTSLGQTNAIYANEGWEDALTALAGIYGLGLIFFDNVDTSKLIQPLLISYLVYASDNLQKQGKAANEDEGVALALAELLSLLFDNELTAIKGEGYAPEDICLDDLVVAIGKFINENPDSVLASTIAEKIVGFLPEDQPFAVEVFKQMVNPYNKNYDPSYEGIDPASVIEFFKACYAGADPQSPRGNEGGFYATDKYARSTLYLVITIALQIAYTDIEIDTSSVMTNYTDEKGNSYMIAPGTTLDVVNAMKNAILIKQDDEGVTIETYANFTEAADGYLKDAFDTAFVEVLTIASKKHGEAYANKLKGHIKGCQDNIRQLRELLMEFFFYEEAGFNTKDALGDVLSLISSTDMIGLAHYNELYIAYAKAQTKVNPDSFYIEHIPAKAVSAFESGSAEYWIVHENGDMKCYSDNMLTKEIAPGSMVIEPTVYKILDGDNQSVIIGDDGSLTIRADGPIEKFLDILLDGVLVDPSNYTVRSGSTIVTFKPEFLASLDPGEHTVTFVYTDGYVNATVRTSNGTPQTGDFMSTYMVLMVAGLSAAAVATVKKKKSELE